MSVLKRFVAKTPRAQAMMLYLLFGEEEKNYLRPLTLLVRIYTTRETFC